MVGTHGLSHISLATADPGCSLRLYSEVFGVRECYRDEDQIQALGPGTNDVIAFEKARDKAGLVGGISHFGFRRPVSDLLAQGRGQEVHMNQFLAAVLVMMAILPVAGAATDKAGVK